MKELNDSFFYKKFEKLAEGDGFITDASQRNIEKALKQRNFLLFNPQQFNVYYLAAIGVVIAIVALSVLSNTSSKPVAAPKPKQAEAKPAVKKASPEPKKEVVAAAETPAKKTSKDSVKAETATEKPKPEQQKEEEKKTEKNSVKAVKEDFEYFELTEVVGAPVWFYVPVKDFGDSAQFYPAIPDSLPPQKEKKVKPVVKVVPKKVETVDTIAKKDTAVTKPKVKDTVKAKPQQAVADPIEVEQQTPVPEPKEVPKVEVQEETKPSTEETADELSEPDDKKKRRRKDK